MIKKSGRRRLAGALLVAAFLNPLLAGSVGADTLRVGGTGAALGSMRLLGEEFSRSHPEITVRVLPYIGSTGAIKEVLAGNIDLGLSGRPAKPAEEKDDLRLERYADTLLVIATHPAVNLKSISSQQLAAIYAGQTLRWDNGGLIRLILRPASETDNEVLRKISPALDRALDVALARPGMRYAATDQDAAEMIEQSPGALGTTTLALVLSERRRLGITAIDGIMPSVETLKNGRYPFRKPLFLVSRSRPSAALQSFIDFVRSPRGHDILLANGQLPVTR